MKKQAGKIVTLLKYYSSPEIIVEHVCLEHSVAAGSAIVTPLNSQSQIRQEWETAPDVVGNQAW
ncbi:hypothetical protein [Sphingobacterium corticibacter]|uniref:Uncharacterized protein n=1 Tax=Sphingobacterium corticibacter TaxID=2171749 RepID=A0A2T8HMF1_9SPHI|nr:hypothetical protein [Sphingobacterium corticibacter]PVH26628.1 hypothetical protein DC487_03180 [Sphingobacterium corticibacter]